MLATLTDSAALPALVPKLAPGALKQMVDTIGMEDAGAVIEHATPAQIAHLVDESIWTTAQGSVEVGLSTSELLRWFEVWLTVGEEFAATKLIDLGEDFMALALTKMLRVRPVSMVAAEQEYYGTAIANHYLLPRDLEGWDALQGVLMALWEMAPNVLEAVLYRLSQIEGEYTPTRRSRLEADLGFEREQRRARHGYVDTPTANAFLATAAGVSLDELMAATEYAPYSSWYLGRARHHARTDAPSPHAAAPPGTPAEAREAELDELQRELEQYEFMQAEQRALLTGPEQAAASPLRAALAHLRETASGEASTGPFDDRTRELSYLANTLMSVVSLTDRALGERDAAELAMATCDLGADYLFWLDGREDVQGTDPAWTELLQMRPGLERLFRIGWRLLAPVPRQVASGLGRVLTVNDRFTGEHAWLADEAELLTSDLTEACDDGNFESARQALTALGVVTGPDALAQLLPLVDTVPRLRPGADAAPRFIASMQDLAAIDTLMSDLAGGRL